MKGNNLTYLELESLESKAQIKNDYEDGYDACMKGKKAPTGKTALYYDGYAHAYELQERQSNGNN